MIDNVKVVLLAGGLGTRLQGALGGLPKPLAPIGDKPFLEYLINLISAQGFRDIVLCCGHGADVIRDHFGDGRRLGVSISYTIEEELLGTGGAIKLAEPLIDAGIFVVANGDTYFETDLKAMVAFHAAKESLATLALAYREDTGRYGRVVFDKENKILSFTEKGPDEKGGYINGGIYVFRRDVFDFIPGDKVCSIEREILPLLIDKGLYGFPVNGYFIDIGIPEDYERAKQELPMRRVL